MIKLHTLLLSHILTNDCLRVIVSKNATQIRREVYSVTRIDRIDARCVVSQPRLGGGMPARSVSLWGVPTTDIAPRRHRQPTRDLPAALAPWMAVPIFHAHVLVFS